ncbi:U3 small nucleolar RNA-associated protein 18 homolog [Neosynchiropus ocellatus]
MADEETVAEEPRACKRAKRTVHTPEDETQKQQENRRRLRELGRQDGSVKLLEDLVFGAEEELLGRLVQRDERTPEEDEEEEEEEEQRPVRAAAWVDEDDQLEEEVDMTHRFRRNLMKGEAEKKMSKHSLQERMRDQFQKVMGGRPSWADISDKKPTDEDGDEDDEDDLMKRTGNFLSSSERLPSGVLRMKRCLHANSARLSDDKLTSVQFHPAAQVVMTAGLDCSVSLFQVDGKTNPKIQSVHLDRFPVFKARFSRDGESVIATSLRNKMFYMYDMMAGQVSPVNAIRGLNEARVKDFTVCPQGGTLLFTGTNGYLHLVTLKTKEVVRSVKVNGTAVGVAFNQDGTKFFTSSEEGEVFVWDVRGGPCVNRFTDDGCVKATSMAASPDGRHLACGSQSGVVNIYSQEDCLTSSSPEPLKAVMNLLTPATSLAFNPSSEILAIASGAENDAVRLVHVPSLSVFSNFPMSRSKVVYRVNALDFSPHSGFFSLANNKGHAPLYRLLHYKSF